MDEPMSNETWTHDDLAKARLREVAGMTILERLKAHDQLIASAEALGGAKLIEAVANRPPSPRHLAFHFVSQNAHGTEGKGATP